MVRKQQKTVLSWPLILSLIAGGSAFAPGMAHAQDENYGTSTNVREEGLPQQDSAPIGDAQESNANQGVVRLARFSYIKGNVTWRADQGLEWSAATTNLPIRQDAQIWVTDGGRAELQFDDGSVLRLGNGALVTLKTLYSDEDGEFTQITLNEGLATLRARHERAVYRMDTPLASVTAKGPAKVRFGIGDGLEVAVRQGQANVEGDAGKVTLESGDFLDLRDANSPLNPRRLPGVDNWDRWNQERDDIMDGSVQRPSHQHLPANIEIVAADLDDYGSWRNDPEYGNVWCPRVASADWRPYHDGHWTWVSPFGWTWVADEAWGWAPYHYGTWVSRGYGWAWCPGPVNQYWSPAVVHFSEYDGRVAWCPLAPREVRYPSTLAIGFRSGNWSAFFSIGQAAVYYPTYNNYCEARPFRTGYVNHVTYVNNVTNVYNNGSPSFNRYYNSAEFYGSNHNTYLQNNHFVPYNARTAAGVTAVAATGFGRRTAYDIVPRAHGAEVFSSGRTVSAPARGSMPVAGPAGVRPTRESLTPTHTFLANTQPPTRTMARPVFQAPLPAAIARRAAPVTPSGQVFRQAPNGQVTRTGREGITLPGNGSRETGRPTFPSGNSSANNGRPLPTSPSTSRGNSGNPVIGRNNETNVNGGGTVHRADPTLNPNVRTAQPGTGGRGETGTVSAAEAARRARGNVGLLPHPNSSGAANGEGNARPNGSATNSRGGVTSSQTGSSRRTEGDSRTYRPGTGSTGATGTGSTSGATGRTSGTGSSDTRWAAERARGRGEDTRSPSPSPRSGGDASPRTSTPPTQIDPGTRGSSPRTGSGYGGSGSSVPSTRGGSEGSARPYSPPPRPVVPEAPRQPSGSGSRAPSPAPAPRTRDAEPSSRPSSPSREKSGDSDKDKSDKDKGGSDRSRGGRGR